MKPVINIKSFISIACVLSALLFACENPWMAEILQEKTITFDSNGGSPVPSQKLFLGESAAKPADPTRDGYVFEGWYEDNGTFEKLYNFDFIPTHSMTLYAKWREATPEDLTIKSVNVKISGPATGETPNESAEGGETGYSCGSVTWEPNDIKFEGDEVYTASVTLTAIEDYIFSSSIDAKINGITAEKSNQTQTSITLSYKFAKTDSKIVKEISIETLPKLTYTYGDKLDLTELVVKLTYEDGFSDLVEFADFKNKNIFTNLGSGDQLYVLAHDGKPVVVSFGRTLTAETNNLTVSKVTPTIEDFEISGDRSQIKGNITPIKIEALPNKTTGRITVKYMKDNDSFEDDKIKNAPIGTYDVTFDVAADNNYSAATGLSAGTLTIKDAIFNKATELAAYLNALPANSSGNPYKIEWNIENDQDFQAIKSALDSNSKKYVILDLSGSLITSIPNNAFCTGSVDTVSGDPYISPTESLVGVIIPNTVKTIGNDAFCGCDNLANVTIPSGVKTIGDNAFKGCKNLADVTIPNTVTSIGEQAFGSCPITSVVIPSSVTSIGRWAFDGGEVLTSVEFQGDSTDFDSTAFGNNNDLLAKYLEGGAGTYTRPSGTNNTWTITFDSVDALGTWLEAQDENSATNPYFVKLNVNNLSGIANVLTSNTSKYISLDLSGSTFTKIELNAFKECTSLTSINIPEGVTEIENAAFSSCTGLTSINIPDSVTKIGTLTFNNCSALTNIIIPNRVTSIGQSVFSSCTNLTSLTIGSGLTSFGPGAFSYCTSLTSVKFESANINLDQQNDWFIDLANTTSLKTAYAAGGIGTYTRPDTTNSEWTRQQ